MSNFACQLGWLFHLPSYICMYAYFTHYATVDSVCLVISLVTHLIYEYGHHVFRREDAVISTASYRMHVCTQTIFLCK